VQDQLLVGLVGCGGISAHYVRLLTSFADRARVVAVCDLVQERAAERSAQFAETYLAKAAGWEADAAAAKDPDAQERLGTLAARGRAAAGAPPRVYGDFEQLVRDPEVQMVVVSTQPVMHPVVSLAALEAGRHVFTEGPMAAHLRDADAMIAAARRRGVKLTVQYCTRFFREAQQAKLAIAGGKLGKLALGRVDASWHWGMEFYRDTKFGRNTYRGTWQGEGGGSAFHHGRYASDLFLHLMGEPVAEVSGFTGRVLHNIETEDVSSAALRFRSGALGHVTTTICAHRNESIPYDRVEILGERASLQVFRGIDWRATQAQAHFGLSISAADPAYAAEVRAYLDEAVPATDEDMQVTQMRLFLDAIQIDGAAPVPGESARAHVELVRATYKSAFTGAVATLPLAADDPFYGPEGTTPH
jgi:predicted dehydrogenase